MPDIPYDTLLQKERARRNDFGEPSNIQKFLDWIKRGFKPSLLPTIYGGFAWGIDISHYQQDISWDLLKGRGIDFVIAKCGEVDDTSDPNGWMDSMISSTIQNVYNISTPENPVVMGAYYFLDGGAYWLNHNMTMVGVDALDNNKAFITKDPHISTIIKTLHSGEDWILDPTKLKASSGWKRFHFIALDVERWWRTYNDYYVNGTNAKRIEAPWIAYTTRVMVDRLRRLMMDGQMPTVPIVIYSRKYFISDYSPELDIVCGRSDVEIWPAHWYWNPGYTETTIEELRTTYLPPDTFKPYLFGNKLKPKFWQYSGDRYAIGEVLGSTGKRSALDLNLYWGSKADMYNWLKIVPADAPSSSLSSSRSSSRSVSRSLSPSSSGSASPSPSEPPSSTDPTGSTEPPADVTREEFDALAQRVSNMESYIQRLKDSFFNLSK